MRRDNGHRRVWIKHNGPIPKDEDGRALEVHHIDGDHENNDITNLMLVSIDEHYAIHYAQGDWAACKAIAMRAVLSPDEISEIARCSAVQRLENGTHHFLNSQFKERHSKFMRERAIALSAMGLNPFQNPKFIENDRDRKKAHAQAMVKSGLHNFLDPKHQAKLKQINSERIANGTHNWQNGDATRARQLKRVMNGTHHFLGGKMQSKTQRKRVAEGKHHFLGGGTVINRVSCIVCHRETTISGLGKHKRCREKLSMISQWT